MRYVVIKSSRFLPGGKFCRYFPVFIWTVLSTMILSGSTHGDGRYEAILLFPTHHESSDHDLYCTVAWSRRTRRWRSQGTLCHLVEGKGCALDLIWHGWTPAFFCIICSSSTHGRRRRRMTGPCPSRSSTSRKDLRLPYNL